MYLTTCCTSSVPISDLRVTGIPKGGRVVLRCIGGGCSPARRSYVALRGTVATGRTATIVTLTPPAKLAIEVIAPGTIGRVDIVESKSVGPPIDVFRCLPPGAVAPLRCA